METRITVISDTHCRHEDLELPAGDLLIHCGDMFNLSDKSSRQLAQIDDWFGRQRFERILYTGGNHDHALQSAAFWRSQPLRNAYFLRDKGLEFRGLKIYGAPWVPDLATHAFYKKASALGESWAKVPAGVDILITHTPPAGILDESSNGRSHGCKALIAALPRIAPRVHCFGHVHASRGQKTIGETLFINASSIQTSTGTIRPPIAFTLLSRA